MTERTQTWVRTLLIAIPIAVTAILAFGAIKSDVTNLQIAVSHKADAAVVQTQYDAILRELQGIHQEIRDVQVRRR